MCLPLLAYGKCCTCARVRSNEYSRFDAKFARDIDLRRKHYCPDSTGFVFEQTPHAPGGAAAAEPAPGTGDGSEPHTRQGTARTGHGTPRLTIGHDTCARSDARSSGAGTAGGADRGRSGPRVRSDKRRDAPRHVTVTDVGSDSYTSYWNNSTSTFYKQCQACV